MSADSGGVPEEGWLTGVSGARGNLSAMVSAGASGAVVVMAFQHAYAGERVVGCVVGMAAVVGAAPVGALLALGIIVLAGGRLRWLQVGVGPRLGGFRLGSGTVELRLVPVVAAFGLRVPPADGARPVLRRFSRTVIACGPALAAALLYVWVPGLYRTAIVVGGGLAWVAWLLILPDITAGQAVREAGAATSSCAG